MCVVCGMWWCVCVCGRYVYVGCVRVWYVFLTRTHPHTDPKSFHSAGRKAQKASLSASGDKPRRARGVDEPAPGAGESGPSGAGRPLRASGELRRRPPGGPRHGGRARSRAAIPPQPCSLRAWLLRVSLFSQLSGRTSAPASGPILPQRDRILT